jgi:tetratricopeptide (TPR) repeat protein
MPAHIYLQTGDFDKSAKSNEEAAAADRAYIQKTGARGIYPAMYYSHNLHFLFESYNRAGRFGDAKNSADRLAANVKQHIAEMLMIEAFLPPSYFVLVYFNRWDEMLRAPEPDKSLSMARTFWHYGRAVAFAGTGKLDSAANERKAIVALKGGVPADASWGNNTIHPVIDVALTVIDARIAQAKGDHVTAVSLFRKAVEGEDAFNYDEPPAWYYPLRQSLGAALLRAGNAGEAEKVFRAALDRSPRNGRLLFGLTESLKAQGKTEAARLVQREFEQAWKAADTKLKIEDL